MNSVRNKLIGSFTIVLVFVVSLAILGLSQIGKMNNFTQEVTGRWMYGLERINEINLQIEQYVSNYYQLSLTKDPNRLEEVNSKIDSLFLQIDEGIIEYKEVLVTEEEIKIYTTLTKAWESYKEGMELLYSSETNTNEKAEISKELNLAFEQMRASIQSLIEINHNGAVQSEKDSQDLFISTRSIIFYFGVVIIALIIALSWVLTRNLTRPLIVTTATMNRIAAGDLTVKSLIVNRKDEFGTMMEAVNRTITHLQLSIKQMQASSDSVAAAAKNMFTSSEQSSEAATHVAESIQQVASGSDDQAKTALECSRVIDEMAEGVQRIAESAGDVSELSHYAAIQANKGSETIVQVSARMKTLGDSVEEASQTIHSLEQQSQQISEISAMIGEIAAQTSLLALNASIEAARAGEHGRGFAVVAGEVRKLAAQSNESVFSINEIITSITQDTITAVAKMGLSLAEVHQGILSVSYAERAFEEIVNSTSEVSARVQETAAATEQLAASTQEVSASIANMGHIAQKTAEMSGQVAASTEEQLASSEEITNSAQSLFRTSEELKKLVNTFSL